MSVVPGPKVRCRKQRSGATWSSHVCKAASPGDVNLPLHAQPPAEGLWVTSGQDIPQHSWLCRVMSPMSHRLPTSYFEATGQGLPLRSSELVQETGKGELQMRSRGNPPWWDSRATTSMHPYLCRKMPQRVPFIGVGRVSTSSLTDLWVENFFGCLLGMGVRALLLGRAMTESHQGRLWR